MKSFILCIAFLSALNSARGQEVKHYPITSIQPQEVSNNELDFLQTEIGDTRIVFLGEQDHGDGGAMLAKTLLVKYLVQHMGFSALVFEGDFLTLNDAALSTDQKWNKLAGIWKNSHQMISLHEFINDNEVEIAGIDLFGTTGISQFKQLFWSNCKTLTTFSKEEINKAIHGIFFNTKSSKNALKEVYRLSPILIKQTKGFEQQLLKSFQFVIDSYKLLPKRNKVGLEKYQERDLQMGNNLHWMMNNVFSEKKVIVWAANFHIANNPNEIESEKSWRFRSGELESMGNQFDKLSNIKSYRIAITSFGGSYTDWSYNSKSHIEIRPERHNQNSLELILSNQDIEYAFVPLKEIKHGFSLSGFAHKAYRGNWHNVFDAVFFLNQMTPSTYIEKGK